MSRLALTDSVPVPAEVGKAGNDNFSAARLRADLREASLADSPSTPTPDAIFDDLERVLGERAVVTEADVPVLARRLHAVFRRLVHLSQIPGSGVPREAVAAALGMLTELMPPDFQGAVGYLRRLALTVSDLLDELLEDMP